MMLLKYYSASGSALTLREVNFSLDTNEHLITYVLICSFS